MINFNYKCRLRKYSILNNMTIKITKQGRLLPKYDGIYQCHPKDWVKEFEIANKYNFNCTEWIVDERSQGFNPNF